MSQRCPIIVFQANRWDGRPAHAGGEFVMQTTQKRQEDDVKVRRAAGPLHFIDANQPTGFQYVPQGAFETPLAVQFAALPAHLAYGPQTAYGVPQLQWAQPMPSAFAPNPRAAGMAYPQPQMTNQGTPGIAPGLAQRVPACDIVDEGSEYVCQVELPGVKRENVDVSCFERALLITAHAEPEIDVGALVLSERGSTASFRRAITLPSDIQTTDAKAALRDGILTINLPKAKPTAGPKRIPVA